MEFRLIEKGKRLVRINGYTFGFHEHLKDNVERWNFTVRSCNSVIKLMSNAPICGPTLHNHDSTDCAIQN